MSKQADQPAMRAIAFVAIVLVAVIALIFVWKQMPSRDSNSVVPPTPTTTPAVLTPDGLSKADCEAAHGHWTDCGSPCHGKNTDTCIQVCEAQCLCGGIAGWQCPKDFTCTDYDPGPNVPDALGVCRKGSNQATSTDALLREAPAGMVCGERNAICISQRVKDSLLSNPIMVTGTVVGIFENQFQWKLTDATGTLLEQGAITASGTAGDLSNFQIRQFFSSLPHTTSGILTIFDSSPKDGQPIYTLAQPVRLPNTVQTVKLALLPKTDTNRLDCSKTIMVEVPIVKTGLPVEATIQRLLNLPPPSEIQNATSAIPEGTKLISVSLNQGTLSLVFSKELDAGGSCRVAAISAEITNTAKQFSNVKKVVISVEGKTPEESLQP
ncbi:MAG TPA: GerMN domain-containing protein [Patescibacteria group bacterium]|nr:GerMN domain-containing protein [Patescibacteria group bacterium]